MNHKINADSLRCLIDCCLSSGKKVVAPVSEKGKIIFKSIKDSAQVELNYIQTTLSPKGVFFPGTEEILKFDKSNDATKIIETIVPKNDIILLGIKPCDAYGLNYLTEFFLKENADTYFKLRRDNTTIVGISCSEHDNYCFCTSVNLSPGDTTGSDLLLTKIDGYYLVETLTDKGDSLVKEHIDLLTEAEYINKEEYITKPPIKFDLSNVLNNIAHHYNDKDWTEQSLSCFGCGACAFSCPTCSCYDLQDERNPFGGRRLKNWDTCGLDLFTIHSSGHNPRHVQSQRWKHRIMHKFNYSVKNMDKISCVGCGRCIRVCPGGMDIVQTVKNFV
jgi:ferredoxin